MRFLLWRIILLNMSLVATDLYKSMNGIMRSFYTIQMFWQVYIYAFWCQHILRNIFNANTVVFIEMTIIREFYLVKKMKGHINSEGEGGNGLIGCIKLLSKLFRGNLSAFSVIYWSFC